MTHLPSTLVRQIFLILLIVLLFGVLFWNLRVFVPALLGAYAFYVLLRKPLFILTDRYHWPVKGAAALLLLLSFVVVFLPVNWVFNMLQGRLSGLFANSDQLLTQAQQIIRQIEDRYDIRLLTSDNIKPLGAWMVGQAQGLLSATVSGLGLLVAMYFILWFMLTAGKRMEYSFFNWLPLRQENVVYVRQHLNDLVWGNALGIPLMGLVQGFAALAVYWLAGVSDPWMWFAVTFVAGMMPVVGAALAYVPLSLLLLADGEQWKALLIFAYGFLVVGSVDNLARMWLMRKIAQTHPLITLFGVVVGLQLFGFIGFVFGPILISLFIMLLRIYQKEFHYGEHG